MKCHICNYWTPQRGCDHYNPEGSEKNRDLINKVVAHSHGGNTEIVETPDYRAGINAALNYLSKNKKIKIRTLSALS